MTLHVIPAVLAAGVLFAAPVTVRAAEELLLRQPGWISSVAFSPDGRLLAYACSDGTARVRNAGTGQEIAALIGHRDCVVAVAFTPDGTMLATGSYDHTARIWDVSPSRPRFTLEGHRGAVMSVAFSPDGALLATGSLDTTVKLWSVATGELQATLQAHKSWVNAVVFSPDAATLISGSSDGTVKLWDVRRQQVRSTLPATDAEVRSLAISSDGKTLAAGIRYGTIKMWFEEKERFNFKGHESDVWSLAFTPDGLALLSGDGEWNKPGQIKLWDARTGGLLTNFAASGEVLSVACSPDGRRLAAGSWDKTLKVWDAPASPDRAP